MLYEQKLYVRDDTSMVNLSNEVIGMINRQAACSSDFTWPNHTSCVYNNKYNVNKSFVCVYGDCVLIKLLYIYCPTGDPCLISVGPNLYQIRRTWRTSYCSKGHNRTSKVDKRLLVASSGWVWMIFKLWIYFGERTGNKFPTLTIKTLDDEQFTYFPFAFLDTRVVHMLADWRQVLS